MTSLKGSPLWKALSLSLLLTTAAGAAKVQVKNNETYQGIISPLRMTRLAVEEDRIVEVIGDTKTFNVHKEETLGQVFIMPEGEGASVQISIVTEKGFTQDLDLLIDERADASLILEAPEFLKKTSQKSVPAQKAPQGGEDTRFTSEPYATHILSLLKAIATKSQPEGYERVEGGPERMHKSFRLTPLFSYEGEEGLWGGAYKVTYVGPGIVTLAETVFWQAGDRALAFEEATLAPHQATTLYVVGTRLS